MCPHPLQTSTQPDIHTLPSRLPSQHSKHSCQNSETSNTTIVRWLWRARKRHREDMLGMLNWHFWTTHTFQTGLSQVGSTFPASLFSFFTPLCHSCYSPPCPANSLSFFPSICLFLSFALGTIHCCLTSALITAKTSLNLTPHMWVHTAKSSNNTEILQIRSCQINRGISGAHPSLQRGQLEACSRPDLHVKIHLMIQTVS